MTENPYIKTGRGGAGNFVWRSDLEKRQKEDPESASPSTISEAIAATSSPVTPQRQMQSQNPTQHGRGGAGNFIPQPTTGTSSTSKIPITSPPLFRGRGGAGNFQASTAEQHAQSQAEEKAMREREDEVRKGVVSDVETGLQRPEGVWVRVPEGREGV